MSKTLDLEQIKNSCRICMISNVKLNHLIGAQCVNVIEKIRFCTGLQLIKQNEPSIVICDSCLQDLSVAHKFKTLCLLSEETLTKLLEDKVKHETDYDDNDTDADDLIKLQYVDDDIKSENKRSSPAPEIKLSKSIKKGRLFNKPVKPKKLLIFKEKLYCEACDTKFSCKSSLDEHKRDVHKESWICEICGKVFIHRSSHYTHIKSHMPPMHACELCDYKTGHKHDLTKHKRIHAGDKRYQCQSCVASFHTSSNLSCHIRRYHEGIRPFQCHLCEKNFFDRTKLNRHLDTHNDIKRYECQECHSAFTRRCYLKKHLLQKHNISLPRQRPGRQKVNIIVPNCSISKV